jgi:hypothetical protein
MMGRYGKVFVGFLDREKVDDVAEIVQVPVEHGRLGLNPEILLKRQLAAKGPGRQKRAIVTQGDRVAVVIRRDMFDAILHDFYRRVCEAEGATHQSLAE